MDIQRGVSRYKLLLTYFMTRECFRPIKRNRKNATQDYFVTLSISFLNVANTSLLFVNVD